MKRRGVLALVALLVSGAIPGDTAADAARAELIRERRLLSADNGRLAEVTRRLEAALADLATACRSVSDAARTAEGSDEIIRREEALSAAEQDVRALLDRRRLLAERVVDRRRRVVMLESETQARKPGDQLNGRWSVVVQPGEQRGVFRLSLQGTIVSGEYVLEGGATGSLRGTFVNERVRLERVDSKLGFNAIFYGKLSLDGREISGTWEATTFGTGEVGGGLWRAVREEEKEESP
jgi:hypothetical protein